MPRNNETQESSENRRTGRFEPYPVQSRRSDRGAATFDQTPRSGHLGSSGGSRSESSIPSRGSDPERGSILGSTPNRVNEAEMVETAPRGGYSSSRDGSSGSDSEEDSTSIRSPPRMVREAEMLETADHIGNAAHKLVPTAVSDDGRTNWYTGSYPPGFWGVAPDEHTLNQGMMRAYHDLSLERGTSDIGWTMFIQDLDRFDAVKKNEIESRVLRNTGRAENGQAARLVTSKRTQYPPKARDDCPFCPRGGHGLIDCIVNVPEGESELDGCPICNSLNHLPSNCHAFRNMSLRDKVIWSVVKRANKPALKTTTPWYVMLHEWCNIVTYDSGLINGFPWSKRFTEIMKNERTWLYLPQLQDEYDADHEVEVLPVDPATASFYMIWKTYWEPEGLAWPSVLGPRD
ncbi:unnamed protein product [Fusarium equiseti]|uniref:Uncharacterized protein n=1 Tax=Fusarium equiseti TaxID=61235 RepID=A0A8J2J5G2_FUSEQ|nr:unnamed protein product [Fusarium equiseti]